MGEHVYSPGTASPRAPPSSPSRLLTPLLFLLLLLPTPVRAETLVDYLEGTQLTTFRKYLEKTGILQHLATKGPFTLLAPSDQAFSDFLWPGVSEVLDRDPELLRKLIAYHVVVGNPPIRSNMVPNTHAVMGTTLVGHKVLFAVKEGSKTVEINSMAQVVGQDMGPSGGRANGVVHIIDRVLSYPGWIPGNDVIRSTRNKKKKVEAFFNTIRPVASSLGLMGAGPYTIFVPTDSAFAKASLPIKGFKIRDLAEQDQKTLLRVLQYHIVPEKFLADQEFAVPGIVPTLDVVNGTANSLAIMKDATGTTDINQGSAKVVSLQPVLATNGIVHYIDTLLLPPQLELPDIRASVALRAAELRELAEHTSAPQDQTEPPAKKPTSSSFGPYNLVFSAALLALLGFTGFRWYSSSTKERASPIGSDDETAGVPARRRRVRRKLPISPINIAILSIVLLGMLLLPMLSSTRWLIPSEYRWMGDGLKEMLFGSSEAQPDLSVEEKLRRGQLSEMLRHMSFEQYYNQLVEYGIDRVELLASASHEDGKRVRIPPGHWSLLVETAKKRRPDVQRPTYGEHTAPTSDKDKELQESKGLADKYGKQEMGQNATAANTSYVLLKATPSPTAPVTTPAPPKAVVSTDPNEGKATMVLGFVNVPYAGGVTLDCTLGTKHGAIEFRNQTAPSKVFYYERPTWPEIEELKDKIAAKQKGFKDIIPNPKIVHAVMIREPTALFTGMFNRAVGKENGQSEFKCTGKMKNRMASREFTFEDYAKLPDKARAKCEAPRNVQTKALAGIPLEQPVTEADFDKAKTVLVKKINAILLQEVLTKSMYMLHQEFNASFPTYVQCEPYEPDATQSLSDGANSVVAKDNDFDQRLYAEARHQFYTRWAGAYEDKYTETGSCEDTPRLCFDEADKNKEKKVKEPYTSVSTLLRRATSRRNIVCASNCTLPMPR